MAHLTGVNGKDCVDSVCFSFILPVTIQSYPWLYVPSHPSYKDVGKRNNSWQDIATKLDPEGKILGKWVAEWKGRL